MPGAPNRPPEAAPATPPPGPAPETPHEKALRRLAPSRIALRLDLWKGAPPSDLLLPLEKAEATFALGDYAGATNALDLLSVRFAEPRWPTLPEPFRQLRVSIPAPMPPSWDPEHAMSPAERAARRARRSADEQVELARASVAWAAAAHLETGDLAVVLDEAAALLASDGASGPFYERIDRIWTALRERVPRPEPAIGARPAPPRAPVVDPEDA